MSTTMPLQITPPASETVGQIRAAIEAAIPGAELHIGGEGGHFEIRVVSEAFSGKNTLAKQRMVYSAIAHLMRGENAPVHAVDKLETLTP
jgi:acid stress-induced BolA-like protein IbaG/YrbA